MTETNEEIEGLICGIAEGESAGGENFGVDGDRRKLNQLILWIVENKNKKTLHDAGVEFKEYTLAVGDDDWNIIGDEVVHQTGVVDDFGVLDFKPDVGIEQFYGAGESFVQMELSMLSDDAGLFDGKKKGSGNSN